MQRRAAAAYVVFFLVVAVAAYGATVAATPPAISIDPEHELEDNQSVTLNGTEYTVTGLNDSKKTPKINWTEQVEKTRTLEQGETVTQDDANWSVEIPDQDDPSSFQLVETFTVDKPTTTINDTVYVVLEGDDDEKRLVPRDQYVRDQFGEPRTREFSEGDDYNETTVEAVENDSVTLAWTETQESETEVSEGGEVTLGGTTYVAHFEGNTLQLTSDAAAYQAEVAAIQEHERTMKGLAVVIIFSITTAILLLAAAYMPVRRS